MNSLCLIIPTKDRPDELERFLQSVLYQNVRPQQIIIVDGGDPGIRWLADKFPKLPIDYLQVLPPGLTRQRNAGLRVVKAEIDLIAFLDDDIVLEPECLERMLEFWEHAPENTGGAGFNIIDMPPSDKPRWLERLFAGFLKNRPTGALLKSGRNMPYCPAAVTAETEWLCGGATVWRSQIFREFNFDEWFASYGIVEDIDFSYRVSKLYKLFVVAEARLRHIETGQRNYYLQAYVVTMNHLYLAQKHDKFSYPLCVIYMMANGIRHFIYGLISQNKNTIRRGLGHMAASLKGSILGVSRVERQVK